MLFIFYRICHRLWSFLQKFSCSSETTCEKTVGSDTADSLFKMDFIFSKSYVENVVQKAIQKRIVKNCGVQNLISLIIKKMKST